MAKPHSYADWTGEMVKTHPVLPIELTEFVTDSYGKNDKTKAPNSFSKALALALNDLRSLKGQA